MKKIKTLLVMTFIMMSGNSLFAFQNPKTDVSGKWKISIELNMGKFDFNLDLKQENDTLLTGTYSGTFGVLPLKGTLKDNVVDIVVPVDENKMFIKAKVDGDSMKGNIKYTVAELGEGPLTGKRQQ